MIREDYNELVFVEPSLQMRQLLLPHGVPGNSVGLPAGAGANGGTDVGIGGEARGDEEMKDESAVASDHHAEKKQSNKQEDRLKPIDKASLEKGYLDKAFEFKEKSDLELLKHAVAFIQSQVDLKRNTLAEMEKSIKD